MPRGPSQTEVFGTRHKRYLGPYIAALVAIAIVAGALLLALHAGRSGADKLAHTISRERGRTGTESPAWSQGPADAGHEPAHP